MHFDEPLDIPIIRSQGAGIETRGDPPDNQNVARLLVRPEGLSVPARI